MILLSRLEPSVSGLVSAALPFPPAPCSADCWFKHWVGDGCSRSMSPSWPSQASLRPAESNPDRNQLGEPLDVTGTVLAALTLATLTFAVIEAGHSGVSSAVTRLVFCRACRARFRRC